MIHTWIRLNLSRTCQIIWSNEPTLVTFCGGTAEISCGKKSTFISLSILMNMERERERERRGTVVFNNRVVKLFWENVTQLVDKLHALLCQSYFSTTFVWMCITLHYFSFLLLTYLCYYQILLSHSQIKHKRIIGCFIRATNYIKLLTLNKVYMLKV